jgi:hypothetical protein
VPTRSGVCVCVCVVVSDGGGGGGGGMVRVTALHATVVVVVAQWESLLVWKQRSERSNALEALCAQRAGDP